MTTGLWRARTLLLVVGIVPLASNAWARSDPAKPDDSTADVEEQRQRLRAARSTAALAAEAEEREGKEGAEQDDPTYRLEWGRKAFGLPTPEFRSQALALGWEHSRRKHDYGPRWVSIGPTSADYEQNGSFTGNVRDSGRARTILPHPWNPDIVYFLTSGGGLWRTDNWTSDHTRWKPLTDDLPTTGGGSVAFGRIPNTLYLGLGDPYDQILVGGAMVKSRNGGFDWEPGDRARQARSRFATSRSTPASFATSCWWRPTAASIAPPTTARRYSAVPDVRRPVGLEHRAHERRMAGLGAALPCRQRRPALRASRRRSSCRRIAEPPGRRSRTPGDVFAANGRTTLGVAAPRRQRGLRVLERRRTTSRCGTSTVRPTAARPGWRTA